MNNLWQLIKVDFLGSFNIQGKKKSSIATTFKTILCLVVLLGLLISILYNFIFISLFVEGKEPLYYPMMMFASVTSLLTLSTSVFKVKSIFMGKDYEMLSAMPVRKTEIIASKIITLYLVELLYSAIIMIPNTVIIVVLSKNFLYILTGLLATLFAPAIPMMLACLIAMFISLIADRSKFGNVINVLFYIVFFTALFSFSFMMNMGNKPGDDGTLDMTMYINMANVMGWMNPSTMLLKLSITSNPLYSLLYIVGNFAVCVGVIFFISMLFNKVYELINTEYSKEKYVAKKLEVLSQRKTLFKHEAKRFFTSKYYFINSISSGIVALILCVMLGVSLSPWFQIMEIDESFRPFINQYGYWGFVVIAFGIGIATPASVGISIEGAQFWMVKSFPIDYKELMKVKLLLSITVLSAFAVLGSVIMCILINASVLSFIATPILSVLYVTLVSIVSLKINLKHYKLKWKNEMECVKNSSGVVLAMFADWGFTLIYAGLLIGLSFVDSYLAVCSTILVFGIMSYLFYRSLIKNADKQINLIEEF